MISNDENRGSYGRALTHGQPCKMARVKTYGGAKLQETSCLRRKVMQGIYAWSAVRDLQLFSNVAESCKIFMPHFPVCCLSMDWSNLFYFSIHHSLLIYKSLSSNSVQLELKYLQLVKLVQKERS